MDFNHSPSAAALITTARAFISERIAPFEAAYWPRVEAKHNAGDWKRWTIAPEIEALKREARAVGLWNLFLPDPELGAGLSTLEYAPIAEETGRSLLAPEIFNCNAPDTGNMELLWRYGSPAQKDRWLRPLLDGEIRSVFCMTEPDVASSDATNMAATATLDGDQVIVTGRKWWSSGVGDPRARVAIVMAATPDPAQDRHHQHSMVLVPLDAKGVTVERMLPIFGEFDEPHGHGEVRFDAVRVPKENVIAGLGRGFEIAQGRLGPGRIHHCMRCIGAAEAALESLITRGAARRAFGKRLIDLGGNRDKVAEARVAIDQARLLTLHAAWKLDNLGAHGAMAEISAIKLAAPRMLAKIVDDAIQIHGGAGVTRDRLLSQFFLQARTLRLADGPDEVHSALIAKAELKRHGIGRDPAVEGGRR